MRPGGVVVLQVFGRHLAQVVLIDKQQPAEEARRRRVPVNRSQMALALGACGGLVRIRMPSAVNTASEDSVNCLHGP